MNERRRKHQRDKDKRVILSRKINIDFLLRGNGDRKKGGREVDSCVIHARLVCLISEGYA